MFKKTGSVLILLFLFTSILAAQRKYDEDYQPDQSLRERLFIGTYIGSPFISGGPNGSTFGLGLQPFGGIRLGEYFATGVTMKFDYVYLWIPGNSFSLIDLGSTVFFRTTLLERFIAQIEGGIYSRDLRTSSNSPAERVAFPILNAGIGYSLGNAEILLSYEVTGNLSRYRIPFEYKYGFIWNF